MTALNTAALRVHAPKRVTIRWLLRLGACPGDWQEAFRVEWPDGAPVAPESLLRAQELGMDIAWLAEGILTPAAQAAYAQATANAWAAYEEERAKAWAAYEEERAAQATAKAWAAYDEATAKAWAAYQEERAPALIGILWPDTQQTIEAGIEQGR